MISERKNIQSSCCSTILKSVQDLFLVFFHFHVILKLELDYINFNIKNSNVKGTFATLPIFDMCNSRCVTTKLLEMSKLFS